MFKLSIYACALACATLLFADETAVVSGTVSDQSGAIVNDARITLHRSTGASFVTVSGRDGAFKFEAISPGSYLLEASAPGLSLNEARRLEIQHNERKELKLELGISAIATLVSVTSSGAPQSVDQVAKALDVVDVEAAKERGLFSVSDSLRYVPGLRVSTRGSPGAFTTIQTRGLRTTDTAVLIDGFPFRDATSIQDEASAYIGDLLLVDSSRIEVLRGSGSSLYGSNAMSGTVNILNADNGEPLHGDLDTQGGGLGLFRGLAQVAGSAAKHRLNFSAGLSNLNVTRGVSDAGAVRNWSGQGSLAFLLRPNMRVSASAFGNTGYLQLNTSPSPLSPSAGTFTPSLGDPDYGRYSHFLFSLFRFEHDVNSRFSYRLGYGIVDSGRNNTNGPAGPSNDYTFQPSSNTSDRYSGRIDTLQARATLLLGSHQSLTGGYEFQRENYNELATTQGQRTGATARQQTNALFAQEEIRLFDGRLQVLLAGRFTKASLDEPVFQGASVSPYSVVRLPAPPRAYTGDAAISYFLKRSNTKLRAHAGNSFRLPSIYERFGGFFFGGTFYPIGDPNLAPERAVSLDAGFDQYLWHDRLKLSGSYFYSRLQKVIGYLNFPPNYQDVYGRTGGYYQRPGAMARGTELSGDFHPTRKTSVIASYVYTNARDRESQYYTGTSIDPLQTPRIAPHMFTVVATQQITKRITAALDFAGGSSYLFPLFGFDSDFNYHPYAYRFNSPKLLGLSAGYSLPLGEKLNVRFYTRISNVLGETYYEDGFATPGRWAVGGFRIGF